jgi:hypothetical protein
VPAGPANKLLLCTQQWVYTSPGIPGIPLPWRLPFLHWWLAYAASRGRELLLRRMHAAWQWRAVAVGGSCCFPPAALPASRRPDTAGCRKAAVLTLSLLMRQPYPFCMRGAAPRYRYKGAAGPLRALPKGPAAGASLIAAACRAAADVHLVLLGLDLSCIATVESDAHYHANGEDANGPACRSCTTDARSLECSPGAAAKARHALWRGNGTGAMHASQRLCQASTISIDTAYEAGGGGCSVPPAALMLPGAMAASPGRRLGGGEP